MWSISLLLLASTATCAFADDDRINNTHADNNGLTDDYPPGSPWRCVQRAKANGYHLENFEVLPGFGWDNLRNVNEGKVVFFNYSQCRTTDDGRFLLPDSVTAVPIKSTQLQLYAELIDHWKDWTSSDSLSINVEAGLTRDSASISGKFSLEFSNMKSKQINDKSATTRTQLRYTRYAVHLQPDSELHPAFRKRVLGIANAFTLGEDPKGNFLSELLVRDFGTHIVTKAIAGATLLQEDFIDGQWAKEQQKNGKKADILATGSYSLFRVLEISASVSFEYTTSEQFMGEYTKQRTSSRVLTKGGPPFLPSNFTATAWAESVDTDLVALDRSGDPLHYVITREAFPELPFNILSKVHKGIRDAEENYYSYNMIPGCLDPDSSNFSPAANVDDNTCKKALTNLTFGGVFQTCQMTEDKNGDLCGNLRQVNPLSGGEYCPTGFNQVSLHTGTTSSSSDVTVCETYLIFLKKCHIEHHVSVAEYTMYWCESTSSVPPQAGYKFGGVFTSYVPNPVTGSFSCPPDYFTQRIGDQSNLRVCISDEQGHKNVVLFGGFYSCHIGNPVAIREQSTKVGSGAVPDKSGRISLRAFYDDRSQWPKMCPSGFSSYVASVDQNCQINYCITSESLPNVIIPPIKRPPFSPEPPVSASHGDTFLFDPSSNIWKRHEQ